MTTYHGIAVYEILPDGCLNGVWADSYGKKQIFNEIAKSRVAGKEGFFGTYECSYTDVKNSLHICTLEIKPSDDGHFKFLWYKKPGENISEGTGWRTKHNQITVYFTWSK